MRPNPRWRQTTKRYETLDGSLRFDVTISTTSGGGGDAVVRVQSNLTALKPLGGCVGGLALLNLTLAHAAEPAVLYGSTGGPAGAATALQPWQCPLD